MIRILSREHLRSLLLKVVLDEPLDLICTSYLFHAFEWRTTIEGHDHWARIYNGIEPFTRADRDSLLNQINGKEPPPRPPEEDLWI